MSNTGDKRLASSIDTSEESPAKRPRTDENSGNKKKALLGKLLSMQSKVDSLIEPKQNGTQSRKGRKGRGPRSVKKSSKKSESSSPASRPKRARKPARTLDSDFKLSWEYDACKKILKELRTHEWSWPFLKPVDPDKLGLPDYFDIIKHPMDLGTIASKLDSSEYDDIEQFASDVRLVWNNCITYNPPHSDVVAMAKTLQDIFEKRYKDVLEGKTRSEPKESSPKKTTRRRKAPEPVKPMTIEEKRELSTLIGDLSDDDLGKVVEIIQSRAPTSYSQSGGDEVVVDLEQLDAATLRQIEKHVRSAVSKKKRKSKGSGRRSRTKKQSKKTSTSNQQKKNAEVNSKTNATPATTIDSQQTSGNGEPSTTTESGGKPSEAKEEKQEKSEEQGNHDTEDELTDVSTASSSSDSDSGSDSSDSETESKLLDPSAPRPLTLVLPDSSKSEPSSSSQKTALSYNLSQEPKKEETNDEGEAPKIITSAHKPQEVKLKNAAAWSFADEPDISGASNESTKADTDATWSEFKSISQQREKEQREQQEKLRLQEKARKQQFLAEQEKRKREIEEQAERRKREQEEAELKELKDREEARLKARREREKMAQNASAEIDEDEDENWDSLEFSQALSFEGFESKPEHLSDN